MPNRDEIRDTAEAVKGIVEAVPIYQDALQPAAKELGVALQTIAKSIHLVLAPVSALVWGYERIRDYVIASLAERFQNIPKERLITPSPTVAGPVLEALRYAGHEPTLRELYANLLATSMDVNTAREAHPAFVDIIRQLTPDEARLVGLFALRRPFPIITVRALRKEDEGGVDILRHFSLLGEEAACTHPELIPGYLDNLCRLGLAEIPAHTIYTAPGVYEPLENHFKVSEAVSEIQKEDMKPEIKREALFVTTLGRQFIDACVLQRDSS